MPEKAPETIEFLGRKRKYRPLAKPISGEERYARVAAIKTRRNLTWDDIARRLGMNKFYILEKTKKDNVDIHYVWRLARILKLQNPRQLLWGPRVAGYEYGKWLKAKKTNEKSGKTRALKALERKYGIEMGSGYKQLEEMKIKEIRKREYGYKK